MKSILLVKIILPSETYLDTKCEMVNIPATDGVMGILPDHIPFIADMSAGVVTIINRDIKEDYFISGGIARIDNNSQVAIITEYAASIANAKRNDINKKIDELYQEIVTYESDTIDYDIIAHNIQRYKSLLKFL